MRVVIAPVDATFATHGGTAVVELATAAGIGLLAVPAPLTATTRGVGELIRAALDTGARRIVLGIGGSATADGGAGCCRPPRADGGDRTWVGAWPRRNASLADLAARVVPHHLGGQRPHRRRAPEDPGQAAGTGAS